MWWNSLTRREGEAYAAYLKMVQAAGPLAMQVKVYDLTDNIDMPMPINKDQRTSYKRKVNYIVAMGKMEIPVFHTKTINTIVTMASMEATKNG